MARPNNTTYVNSMDPINFYIINSRRIHYNILVLIESGVEGDVIINLVWDIEFSVPKS